MSFISQAAGIFCNRAELRYQITMFGRNAIYFEGAKPIKLDSDEMIFRVDRAVITLKGEELCVLDMTDDCVSIVGRIDGISVADL